MYTMNLTLRLLAIGGPPSLADDIVVVVDRSNITVCPNEGRNRRGASLCARRLKSRLQESTR